MQGTFLPYLNVVTCGCLETWKKLIFTSSMYCLLQNCNIIRIKITGRKGCGKTVYILCSLLQIHFLTILFESTSDTLLSSIKFIFLSSLLKMVHLKRLCKLWYLKSLMPNPFVYL